MAEDEREAPKGFRVTDRRRFTDEGDLRDRPATQAESSAEPPPSSPDHDLGPVTFSSFVFGLSTQALMHLGEVPNPVTKAVETDLAAASHCIDILAVLREKTRNNLDRDEERLIDAVLFDLRMRYVERRRAGTGKKEEA